MAEGLNTLEQAVLDHLLKGTHPILEILRTQARNARLAKREQTGVGFFCELEVHSAVLRVRDVESFHIADVSAELDSLEHGIGFVLLVRDGRLDTLEGFTFDEPWPSQIQEFKLR